MADYGGVLGGTAGQGQALQDILQQRFREALANQQAQQEQQKIAIEQQRVNNESDLKKLAIQESIRQHDASQRDAAVKAGTSLQMNTPMGTDVIDSPNLPLYQASGAKLTPQDPTLTSRNFSGGVTAGSQAPRIVGIAGQQTGDPNVSGDLTQTNNPGHKARLIDEGLPIQQQQGSENDALRRYIANPNRGDALLSVDPKERASLLGSFNTQDTAMNKPSPEGDPIKNKAFDIRSRQKRGLPVSADEAAWLDSYKEDKLAVPTFNINANAPGKENKQLGDSYDKSAAKLDKLRTPIEASATSIAGLDTLLKQHTPQADAEVAAKLLSATVAGPSSGLRMTKPELDQVAGGAGKWQMVESQLQQWSTNPLEASRITPAQRQQIEQLASALKAKAAEKLKILDDAENALIDAKSIPEHRRIISGVHSHMTDVLTGDPTPTTGSSAVDILNSRRK